MKLIKHLIIGFLFFSCSSQTTDDSLIKVFFPDQIWPKGEYELIESTVLEIDNDGKLDTIKIFKNNQWNDPGDFQKLEIRLSNNDYYEIYNQGDWIKLENKHVEQFKDINQSKSQSFIITQLSDRIKVLMIFGWKYASSPGNLTIVDISKSNVQVLYNDLFDIKSIEDLDNDGIMELVGIHFYGQGYNIDSIYLAGTYCPHYVLKYQSDSLIPDVSLSENFNVEKNKLFFGLDYDRDQRYDRAYSDDETIHNDYYLFEKYRKYPETSLSFLTEKDLINYSKEELRIIRNEIFAFHGYKFKSNDLNKYFSDQKWYIPSDIDVNSRLNIFEKANIKLIKQLESK